MQNSFRLQRGGFIDRTRPLRFTFDGHELSAYSGDTLASGLLAAGIRLVGRSFKFHRPRGILTAGVEEPNALVTLGTGSRREPNVRATVVELEDGLVAESQNRWPSLAFDIGRVSDLLHPLLPAGFYNKTFMWPNWHRFEPAIRRSAGLGIAADEPDPDHYLWRNAHCDVLVVGGGTAGLLAAATAGRAGSRVILVETHWMLGGVALWDRSLEGPEAGESIVQAAAAELALMENVRVLTRTTAVGAYDHGLVTAVERSRPGVGTKDHWRERWWRIRARRIILASGAIEQPLAFPFNDLPGIMHADAVRQYLNRYAVAAGRRVVVATNNDSAYRVALDLNSAGVEVPCLLDTRPQPPAALAAKLQSLAIPVHCNARIQQALGGARVRSIDFETEGRNARHSISCDAIAMSGGWSPNVHLHCHAGGRLRFEPFDACFVPDGPTAHVHAIGSAAGAFDARLAMNQALTETASILRGLGFTAPAEAPVWLSLPDAEERSATGSLGYRQQDRRNRTWIDFQHDVTVSDIDLAVLENLRSVEHVKRYTTAGMSVDQGKTSNLNALAVLAERTGREIPDVGTTTYRPLFVPVTLGAIAGRNTGHFFRPTRFLSAHRQHQTLGAHFDDYGIWRRPALYPGAGESTTSAIRRELHALRNGVGLFDASPLGKFLVRGPDAADFLNRIYANTIRTLAPGSVRYGIMLNEQGIVFDDGVCARLSAEEFWINTTSGGAARIGGWLEEWLQGEWPSLQVVVTDVTHQFATLNVAGPKARAVLESLQTDIDFSANSFGHMQVRTGHLNQIACRILRVSFTGEMSYEISVPAAIAASLWNTLQQAGRQFGMTPFGIEALQIARTEKGYLHVGSDTDGTTIPQDIGFGRAVDSKQDDFVGRRSLLLPENRRADRRSLVGLRCKSDPTAFRAGAHLLDCKLDRTPQLTAGYLTSACYSPTLDSHIGLGLLINGRNRLGETIYTVDAGHQAELEVVAPAHLDPNGERLRA